MISHVTFFYAEPSDCSGADNRISRISDVTFLCPKPSYSGS